MDVGRLGNRENDLRDAVQIRTEIGDDASPDFEVVIPQEVVESRLRLIPQNQQQWPPPIREGLDLGDFLGLEGGFGGDHDQERNLPG